MIIYLIGVILAIFLGILLEYKEENQVTYGAAGLILLISLLSWIMAIIMLIIIVKQLIKRLDKEGFWDKKLF